ncbi:MAG: SAM-dependent methyltransferase [Planctomycetota bacterium]
MNPAELEHPERAAVLGPSPRPEGGEREWLGPAAAGFGSGVVSEATRLLADAAAETVCLQPPRPLAESLDWELGQLAWSTRAREAFFADGVPFVATSDGWLARNAAELLYTALAEAAAQAPLPRVLPVLELGAGLGLFARGFLTAFRDLCQARDVDYYGRLHYVVTDKTERMLDEVRRSGVLADHRGRWQTRRLDALRVPDGLTGPDGIGPFYAVFANYVLDLLPAAVLYADASGLRELCVGTGLAQDCDLADHTDMSLDELLHRARSDSAADRAALAEVQDLLVPSFCFRPTAAERVPCGAFVERLIEPGQYVLHNYGALQCLEGLVASLRPDGFVLIADYGQTDGIGSDQPWQPQRFGPSLAIGVNFPLLAAWCREELGCECLAPGADPGKLCCRLVGPRLGDQASRRFRERFGQEAFGWEREPLTRARACAERGDRDGALRAFAEAVRRQGSNWALCDEIARFLIYTAGDYARGLDMASLALDLNPVCPGPWTTYGDALFYLGRLDEARSAFDEALRRDPENPRAFLSLAFTHAARRDYGAALRAVAEGLRWDHEGAYQDWLLRRQEAILGALGTRREQRRKALAVRSDRNAPAQADDHARSRPDA